MSFTFSADDNPQKFEHALRAEMQTHLEYFEKELGKVRTGRANPALVEDLNVNCYGSNMRLKDLATISAPEAQLIVIQPWDQGNIEAIERAISLSELHVNPVNDGIVIRIQLPPMSAARRDELTKMVSKKLEECKIALRNVRRDFNNLVRDLEKNKSLSEDIAKRLQTILQKVTDDLISRSEAIYTKKENELKTS